MERTKGDGVDEENRVGQGGGGLDGAERDRMAANDETNCKVLRRQGGY